VLFERLRLDSRIDLPVEPGQRVIGRPCRPARAVSGLAQPIEGIVDEGRAVAVGISRRRLLAGRGGSCRLQHVSGRCVLRL
jgi:hypothetical protein